MSDDNITLTFEDVVRIEKKKMVTGNAVTAFVLEIERFKMSKLIGWKLLSGSHEFPGPKGGTCINEVAVIARGFDYKSIGSAEDMPPCFSRIISQFALELNDSFSDQDRNELLSPFIARLAGTKDRKRVELKRLTYIVSELLHQPVPEKLQVCTVSDFIDYLDDLSLEYQDLKVSEFTALHRKLSRMTHDQLKYFIASRLVKNADGDDYTMTDIFNGVSGHVSFGSNPKKSVEVLEKAIEIGKHENLANVEIINQRMKEYKEKGKDRYEHRS